MKSVCGKRIGEILVDDGVLSIKDVESVLTQQKQQHGHFGAIAIRLELCTEKDVLCSLVKQMGIPYLDLKRYEIDKNLVKLFPKLLLETCLATPIDKIGGITVMAITSPLTQEQCDSLTAAAGGPVQFVLSNIAAIENTIEMHATKESELSELGTLLLAKA